MDNPAHGRIVADMTRDPDVLIVGGGLIGPTLALALAQGGIRSAVLDALPLPLRRDPGFDGRAYALALASQRLLAALGVWNGLRDAAQPILEVVASDGRAGEGPAPFFLHLDQAEIEEGPLGYMIEDRFLRPALLEAMAAAGVEHRAGAEVVAQEAGPAGIAVTLASGERLSARLLVGADGRASGVANRAGIGRTGWDYGQTALVCAVAHEAPHRGIAHQFFMPAGPLAILPLPGNRSSIVWSERRETAAALAALGEAEFLETLRPRFGDFLGAIRLAGDRYSYPLGLSLANALVAPRVALVGDAAHGIHPIAGQGLNLGLRDVGALAEVLTLARRRGEDIGAPDVLARYQSWRRFDTAALAIATDAFNRLFSNDNALLRGIRDLGMGLINALPGARRALIREAAGLTGEVPRLLRGRPV
ncbi:MAG: FAD-dependent monooxygenase [Rhodobacteraceae bacterium]|nr:FAD-dependent monooxygenase [Paracoccaceae bacterium]